MRKFLFFFCSVLFSFSVLFAQGWKADLLEHKGFIENKGQFNKLVQDPIQQNILFAYDGGAEDYFFTPKGHVLVFSVKEKRVKSEEEKAQRLERKKQGFKSLKEWQEFEKAGEKIKLTQDELSCLWLGANPDVQVIAEEKNSFSHSYLINTGNSQQKSIDNISSYKKLIYKNLYNHVDLVYEFHPKGGLKYSLVLHPGANLHHIQLQYSKYAQMMQNGSIETTSIFGNIVDHQPLTFYKENAAEIIPSSYKLSNNIISFELANYDNTKTIIIDPWTQSPSFNTNWDCVWECERDGLGNVYIIGGVMPLQLLKYNPTGALQWTYNTPYDSTSWLGSFATDLAGNSYVCNGTTVGLIKVNTNGVLSWNNPNPGGIFTSTEFWSISFNCDQTKLIIGGTGGFIPPVPYIFEVDMNNGNVLSNLQVSGSPGGLFDPREIRSITESRNGKFYYLSHDSLGYINQNLSACGGLGESKVNFAHNFILGYKVENWRYNNSGIEALKTFGNYVYINKGDALQKRDFYTGAIIGNVVIPGGSWIITTIPFIGTSSQVGNSGIGIDDCGNIFVGSTNGVYQFDSNLVALGNFPTAFNVYDVEVSTNGDVIAAGSTGNSNSNSRTGSVQSFAAAACAPPLAICCDASVCNIPSACATDAPFQLVATTVGGVWSGTGVSAGGVFDPSVSGVGVFTITYSLSCGYESINITVNNCTALNVCEEVNGTYTVSGGTGPYTWQVFSPATTTAINTQAECVSCGYTWFFGGCFNPFPFPADSCTTPAGWTTYATGVNAPVPPSFPAQVIDNAGTIYSINSAGQVLPCANCPVISTNISSQTDANCAGGTGTASISSSGGTGPYTYLWMPGNLSGDSQNNLTAGTYNISIADANGCTGNFSLTINEPAAINYTSGVIASTCGNTNGIAFISSQGGTSPYNYTWSNAGGNLQITSGSVSPDSLFNLGADTYFVLVQDANGCSTADTLIVTTTSAPTATLFSQTDATCGVNNGSIAVLTTGGNPAYTYNWYDAAGLVLTTNNVVSIDSIVNINAGNYTVIVVDLNACSDTLLVLVNNLNAAVPALVSQSNLLCFGEDTAVVVVSATGGITPYNFVWSLNTTVVQNNTNSIGFDTLNTVIAGQYLLELTDSAGCISTLAVTVSGPVAALTITAVNVNNATCSNSDGSIGVVVNGGTVGGGYQYLWQPNVGTTSSVNNLAAASYTLTIIDANACSLDTTIVVANTDGPLITFSNIINVNCFGENTGSATANAIGGTGAYTYLWSSGLGNSATANNMGAGTFSVLVTDALGCTSSATVDIIQPEVISANINTTAASCAINNGSAQVLASGGTGVYTYAWSNGGQSSFVGGLSAGSISVIVTDNVGCGRAFSDVVSSTGIFTVDAGPNANIEAGQSVQLQGIGPVDGVFNWTPSESLTCSTCVNPVATPDTTTIYILTVTQNGCVASDTVIVDVEIRCGDTFVPSGFSPNDDGFNDVLYPRGNCITYLEFKIFDRWGELVFESSDQSIGWDGTYKGKAVLPGVYVFTLSATVKGDILFSHGDITLVR